VAPPRPAASMRFRFSGAKASSTPELLLSAHWKKPGTQSCQSRPAVLTFPHMMPQRTGSTTAVAVTKAPTTVAARREGIPPRGLRRAIARRL